jgi:hypothetical protein
LEHFVSFAPHRQELQRFVSKTRSSVEKEHFGGEFESAGEVGSEKRGGRKENKNRVKRREDDEMMRRMAG